MAVALARARVDNHNFKWRQRVTDPFQLGFDIISSDHIAVSKFGEVELHAGLKAPVQWHVMNCNRRFLMTERFVHGAVKVVGRIQVRAIMS